MKNIDKILFSICNPGGKSYLTKTPSKETRSFGVFLMQGFTLIELLAVIIILAIIALIATPIVLNVVENANNKANKNSAYGIIDGARLYYAESMLDENKQIDINGTTDILGKITVHGEKPKSGNVYVNSKGEIKIALVYGKICYSKDFTATDLSENTDIDTCAVSNPTPPTPQVYKEAILNGADPELTEKLIPIKWDGSAWVYADINEKWYSYESKEWANAVVLNKGLTKMVGQTIETNEIAMMYVWIPRYEYKLPISSIGTTGTPEAIDIKFIDKTMITPTSGYSIHPGFTFGTENKNGMWFGKFEASGKTSEIKIIPNVASLRNINVSTMFNAGRNIESNYGITGFDSHMTRYLEWTTASYLTNSIYGRCTSLTSCTKVTINNSSSYITGNAGSSTSSVAAPGITNAYNTEKGQLASTTGNIYGIYDMSGGAYEYVMGYLSGYLGKSGFSTLPESKYYDVFTSSNTGASNYLVITGINGNASMNGVFKELMGSNNSSNGIWYGNNASSIYSSSPWFNFGFASNGGTVAGVFSSGSYNGVSNSSFGFRVALLPK